MRKIVGFDGIISTPGGLDRPRHPGLTRRQRALAEELGIDTSALDTAGLAAFRMTSARIFELEDRAIADRLAKTA